MIGTYMGVPRGRRRVGLGLVVTTVRYCCGKHRDRESKPAQQRVAIVCTMLLAEHLKPLWQIQTPI